MQTLFKVLFKSCYVQYTQNIPLIGVVLDFLSALHSIYSVFSDVRIFLFMVFFVIIDSLRK